MDRYRACLGLLLALDENYLELIAPCMTFAKHWNPHHPKIIPHSVYFFATGDKIRDLVIEGFKIEDDVFVDSLVYGLSYSPVGTAFDIPAVRAEQERIRRHRDFQSVYADAYAQLELLKTSINNTVAQLEALTTKSNAITAGFAEIKADIDAAMAKADLN